MFRRTQTQNNQHAEYSGNKKRTLITQKTFYRSVLANNQPHTRQERILHNNFAIA